MALPQISDLELEVMKVLWEESPLTSNTVIKRIKDMNPRTVKTLLSRLIKKEAIQYKEEGRTYHYYPVVKKEEYIKLQSDHFVKKLFNGSLNAMFANFLDQKNLSRDELDDLKKMIDRYDDER
ncbi:BlaI/MecI/CopY family transcriptional regulator [Vallitalea pronyensis]|uniref:BlaI/MecI/CopY family transcriptional regulator n=1 Tax=Vallitalea pronyensis TaxID=1348613 RepID=A0A8J8SIA8_9FIRM|nr:BlaI/MecI/CopY family transcriptional regulator [Vallitalea pronyensis]QUI24269.1 BlaI/MecI/CopY family transcriptional regulator [Vallitalea pronyensis]